MAAKLRDFHATYRQTSHNAVRIHVGAAPVHRNRWGQRVPCRGLSLLELVLALSISVIVLGLLSMAVRFQMHTFEKRRDRIEEAQLARAILRSIANDLHSAVAYRPIDLQGVEVVADSSSQGTGGMVNSGAVMGTGGTTTSTNTSGTGGTAANGSSSAGATTSQGTTQPGSTTGANGSTGVNQAGGAATGSTTTGGGQASTGQGNSRQAGIGGQTNSSGGQSAGAGGASTGSATPSKTGSTGQSFGSSGIGTNYSGVSTPGMNSSGSSGGSLNGGSDTQSSATGEASYVAGLYGDSSTLTFDISRLPRVDEYQSFVSRNADDPMSKIPSDVRTVSYYLQDSVPLSASSSNALPPGAAKPLRPTQQNQLAGMGLSSQGLMRQERDRAIASYSNTSASLASTSRDSGEEKLAQEVTRLEFRYFDGYEWWPEWDSDDRGGLPVAIEVVIGMPDRKLGAPAPSSSKSSEAEETAQELFYRLVVRIPTGEAMASSEMGMEQSSEDPSTDTSNQSIGNTGNGSAGVSGAGNSSASGASSSLGGGS